MMNKRERNETPAGFRDLLVSIARSCRLVTRAEAYCWVSRLLSAESDSIYYAWPSASQEDLERAFELRDGADAFYAAADALVPKPAQLELVLDPDEGEHSPMHEVWRSALDKWNGTRPGKAE